AERDTNRGRNALPTLEGGLAFSRVSFRYTNDADPVLLGVNFKVDAGTVVGIAGPNGSGKSSLLKLATGIYRPQAGSVRVDNIDIRQMDPRDLRALISYAPQQCDVFFGTIAQNLYLAHPTATMEQLRWAASLAGLLEEIEALPDGFNTRLFDGQGERMPHGFRQKLSLARAYLKPAPIMLFDEPGNGLDSKGDNAFVDAIQVLRKTTTIMIVSHRPSHLRLADMIVYMQDGYVRQTGTYDQIKNLILGVTR
ncbi:MAG: ATP-binding cassette domain-containing protein, partial [Alphaproteobacteria bacterium]|nr:ATP-binding cassette domain-containing protein [Alphaproteobacteria bacterium]